MVSTESPTKTRLPSYRRHKQSGQAVVTLPDGFGSRRDVLLGQFGTPASRNEYDRVISLWLANGRSLAPAIPSAFSDLSVNELVAAFYRHADVEYPPPSHEVEQFEFATRPLLDLFGDTPAAAFGPLKLQAIQRHMIGAKLCRNVINSRIGRIRRVFRWAVSQELVPPAVIHGLATVKGLRVGRSAAPFGTGRVKPRRRSSSRVGEQ